MNRGFLDALELLNSLEPLVKCSFILPQPSVAPISTQGPTQTQEWNDSLTDPDVMLALIAYRKRCEALASEPVRKAAARTSGFSALSIPRVDFTIKQTPLRTRSMDLTPILQPHR